MTDPGAAGHASHDHINQLRQRLDQYEQDNVQLRQHIEQLTAELNQVRDERDRAEQVKDAFLSTISHELRTPLNVVLGLTEALQEQIYGPLSEKQQSTLRIIDSSGRQLLLLINNVLDLSRIEANAITLNFVPVVPLVVCQASLQAIASDAAQKNLNVTFTPQDLPPLIETDELRLRQILVSLLQNAVKFTPAGGRVGLDAAADTAQGTLRLSVWDTGIGIAPDDIEKLFHPFRQLDSGLQRRYDGLGIGLALADRMTRMLGGSLTVESQPQQGSRFTITLPLTGPVSNQHA